MQIIVKFNWRRIRPHIDGRGHLNKSNRFVYYASRLFPHEGLRTHISFFKKEIYSYLTGGHSSLQWPYMGRLRPKVLGNGKGIHEYTKGYENLWFECLKQPQMKMMFSKDAPYGFIIFIY